MDINKQMLAKKYARACVSLFDSIITKEQLVKLGRIREFLKKHNNSLFYANLGVIDDDIIAKNFIGLFHQYGIAQELDSLIELLIKHKRLFLLKSIIRQLQIIIKERLLLEEFVFSSSHALKEEQIKKLQNYLEKKLKKDIIYTTSINSSLISGIKIYSESLLYEYSIKKKIEALSSTNLG